MNSFYRCDGKPDCEDNHADEQNCEFIFKIKHFYLSVKIIIFLQFLEIHWMNIDINIVEVNFFISEENALKEAEIACGWLMYQQNRLNTIAVVITL